eukprot:CAMPEP_0113535384 /NCGR_PEP_ID=MMETSP0015_2-20120614/5674_1 /TAXON_ID=2838 /ORGANISM="Odontella" /LENGTH=38 /DNA_ID=CAMNT_0000434629 /DNA_START=284 /DNA_END=397 /DNA_ORIENTATION=+ /assembly_acc=CAM_ASM_000160
MATDDSVPTQLSPAPRRNAFGRSLLTLPSMPRATAPVW